MERSYTRKLPKLTNFKANPIADANVQQSNLAIGTNIIPLYTFLVGGFNPFEKY